MQGNRWARIKNHERSILGSVFNAKCKRRIKTETEERRAVSGVELETKAVVVWLIAKITKSKQKIQSKKTKGKYFQYYLLSVCFSCWRNELCSEKTHTVHRNYIFIVWCDSEQNLRTVANLRGQIRLLLRSAGAQHSPDCAVHLRQRSDQTWRHGGRAEGHGASPGPGLSRSKIFS